MTSLQAAGPGCAQGVLLTAVLLFSTLFCPGALLPWHSSASALFCPTALGHVISRPTWPAQARGWSSGQSDSGCVAPPQVVSALPGRGRLTVAFDRAGEHGDQPSPDHPCGPPGRPDAHRLHVRPPAPMKQRNRRLRTPLPAARCTAPLPAAPHRRAEDWFARPVGAPDARHAASQPASHRTPPRNQPRTARRLAAAMRCRHCRAATRWARRCYTRGRARPLRQATSTCRASRAR